MSKEAKSPRIFYGWFVVAACFATTLTMGETFYSFGVFFKPLQNEFNWSRALTSSGYTAFLIGYAISAITAGRLADRHSPRPILLVSALLAGLGISLCGQVQSIDQLRFFFFVAGLGAGATWSIPSTTVQRWFHGRRRAGMALAIVMCGVAVGAMIFAPLINHLILSYGLRHAFVIVGVISFLIVGISSVIIRRSPMDAKTASVGRESALETATTPRWTTRRAAATPAFWSIAYAVCAVIMAFNAVSVHFVAHATDVGISPTAAAAALGLWGGSSLLGRIISGPMADKIGWQKTLVLSLYGMGLSVIWLLFLIDIWMLYCFVFFCGISHGLSAPARPGILGQFFGMRALGELIGITGAMAGLVSAFAPYMAGLIFDRTGSYFVAFIIVMAFVLGAGCSVTIMKTPR